MVKMARRPLVAVVLLLPFLLNVNPISAQEDVPRLYVTDYNHMNEYYDELNIDTGQTERFERPAGYVSYQYGGEQRQPERSDYVSPVDESVRFALLRDFDAENPEEEETLYRVREDDELELILSGEYLYVSGEAFTENGRYMYVYKKTRSDLHSLFYTVYRYDIESGGLRIVAGDVPEARMVCGEVWCELVSGTPNDDERDQSLYVLQKNVGEPHLVETADDISVHYWRGENVLLYTTYNGDGQAIIQTYNAETDQHQILSEIEAKGIASVYVRARRAAPDSQDNPPKAWLLVMANSPVTDRVYDLYIVNDLADDPTTTPLDIQISNATWFYDAMASDGSVLLITLSPQNDGTNEVYIIRDAASVPTVDQLTNTDLDVVMLRDAQLLWHEGDTQFMRLTVSNKEWRYVAIHIPTRTITPLASFSPDQGVVQTLFSPDNRWLAVSIQEGDDYYVGIVATDGSQPLRTWDVGTESYVCLIAWDAPGVKPPACDLYFGIG